MDNYGFVLVSGLRQKYFCFPDKGLSYLSLVGHISNKTVVVVGVVGHVLDSAVGKVDGVRASNNTVAVIVLLLLESGTAVVISHGVGVLVGRGLGQVVSDIAGLHGGVVGGGCGGVVGSRGRGVSWGVDSVVGDGVDSVVRGVEGMGGVHDTSVADDGVAADSRGGGSSSKTEQGGNDESLKYLRVS